MRMQGVWPKRAEAYASHRLSGIQSAGRETLRLPVQVSFCTGRETQFCNASSKACEARAPSRLR